MVADIDFRRLRRAVPMLDGFPEEDIKRLLSVSDLLKATRGKVIFGAGYAPMGLFLVVSGKVSVGIRFATQEVQAFHHLNPGDALGVCSTLRNNDYENWAVATENSLLLYLPLPTIEKMLAARDKALLRLLRGMVDEVDGRIAEMANHIRQIFDQKAGRRERLEMLLGKRLYSDESEEPDPS